MEREEYTIESDDGSEEETTFVTEDAFDEDEADHVDHLLRLQQEEFLRKNEKPSARVVRKSPEESSVKPPKQDPKPRIDAIFQDVVFAVKENEPESIVFAPPKPRSGAFPPVLKQSEWQKLRKKPSSAEAVPQVSPFSFIKKAVTPPQTVSQPQRATKTGVADGKKKSLDDEIDAENRTRIQGMSEQEIVEAQQEIMSAFDPKLIDFLKARSQKKSTKTTQPQNEDNPSTQQAAEGESSDSTAGANESKSPADFRDPMSTIGELDPASDVSQGIYIPKSESEKAKLEWILPAPETKVNPLEKKKVVNFRFGFQGEVLDANAEIDSSVGLHHHGDEPDLPGYTIAELIHLSRSRMPNQRSLSLRILENIISKAKLQAYETDVWSTLEYYDIPLLVRCAIDDSNTTALMAALQCLHTLMTSSQGNESLDAQDLFFRGTQVLPLLPIDSIQNKDGNRFSDMTDSEVLKIDLVAGMVRTKLLDRLRYLMKDAKFMGIDVILDILCQCARHSLSTAVQMTEDQVFMAFIKKSFINTTSSKGKTSNTQQLYGKVNPKAIKLIRLLCQAGRGIASDLSDEGLLSSLGSIISSGSDEEKYESIMLLRSLACYSLHCNAFLDLFPVLCQPWEKVTVLFDDASNLAAPTITIDAAIAALLDQLAHASAVSPVGETVFGSVASQVDNVITGLRSLKKLAITWEILDPATRLVANLFHFLASYHQHLQTHDGLDPLGVLAMTDKIAELGLSYLSTWPLLESDVLSPSLRVKKAAVKSGFVENLPVITSSHLVESSRVNLVLGLVRLLYFTTRINKKILTTLKERGVVSRISDLLVCVMNSFPYEIDPTITVYHLYPFRTHAYCAYYLIKLLDDVQPASQTSIYVYQSALRLLNFFIPGDETYACDLLSSILMNPQYLKLIQVYSASTFADSQSDIQSWGSWIRSHLLDVYTKRFAETDQIITRSEALTTFRGSTTPSLLLPSAMSKLPKNGNWYLHPIQHIPSLDLKKGDTKSQKGTKTPSTTTTTTTTAVELSHPALMCCLQYLSVLFHIEQKSMSRERSAQSLRLWFFSYIHLFLREDNYANEEVASTIEHFFASWCSAYHLCGAPELGAEFDFILERLMGPYTSDSMGNAVFTAFILMFVRQKEPHSRRVRVWKDVLPLSKGIVIDSLPITNEEFLFPVESSNEILTMFINALSRYHGLDRACPHIYWLCIHHISMTIFQQSKDATAQENALFFLQSSATKLSKDIMRDIIHYEYKAAHFPGRGCLLPAVDASRTELLDKAGASGY